MKLIDTHIHLTDEKYSNIEKILESAQNSNVVRMITLGTDVADSQKAAELSAEHKEIFFCAGVHPHEAKTFNEKEDKMFLKQLLNHPKCVGLGEVGLDYYYEFSDKYIQEKVFLSMLELVDTNKPVALHTRDAEKEVLSIIKQRKGKYQCHSYSGSLDLIDDYLNEGVYFSFNGMVTFNKAENIKKIIKKVPTNRIMLESDGPYLSPVPHRGKTNMPEFISSTISVMAKLLEMDIEEVASFTSENAERFFYFAL
jgi:TatD DNase family protein